MRTRRISKVVVVALFAGLFSAPLAPAHAATWEVEMSDHTYNPRDLMITTGDTVTWENVEPHDDDHTVTSTVPGRNQEDPNGPLQSPIISPGQSFSFTFTQPGDYFYYCKVHGFEMSGVVRVRPPGAPFAVEDELSAGSDGSGPATGTVDVLTNDFDRENDPLNVTSWDETTSTGATVTCTPDGVCTYTAAVASCASADSFRYTISDGSQTDSATVTVAVSCGATGEASNTQVSLKLRKHLLARGTVLAEAKACARGRVLKIQRSTNHGWKKVASTRSSRDGSYSARLKDRIGTYRTKAPATMLGTGQKCKADLSPRRRHTH